jgi:hypothetical protein
MIGDARVAEESSGGESVEVDVLAESLGAERVVAADEAPDLVPHAQLEGLRPRQQHLEVEGDDVVPRQHVRVVHLQTLEEPACTNLVG